MRFLPLLALGIVFSGCSSTDSYSVAAPIRERFTGPTYWTRVASGDQRKVYEAAKASLKDISFRYVSGGPAQGKLRALSSVSTSTDLRGSRQVQLDVKLSPAPGGIEVALLFSEILEDDFSKHPGMGTTTPMRDTPLYEVYFRHIEEALAKPARE